MTTRYERQRFLNYAEASLYTSFSIDALRHMVHRRVIPFVKVGRRVLFDRMQLDRYLDARGIAARRTRAPRKAKEDSADNGTHT